MRASRTRTRLFRTLAIGLVCVGTFAGYELVQRGTDDHALPVSSTASGGADLTFVIPKGTNARVQRGEDPGIIPNPLRVRVGQVIRFENLDDAPTSQRFNAAGKFSGFCSVHAGGQVTVDVRD
jgi:plastocyanin